MARNNYGIYRMSVFSYFSPPPVMVSWILLISYGPLHTTVTHCTTKSPFFNPIRYSQSAATRSANHRLSLYSPIYCITTFFLPFSVLLSAPLLSPPGKKEFVALNNPLVLTRSTLLTRCFTYSLFLLPPPLHRN